MHYWSLTLPSGAITYGQGGVPPDGAVEIDADAFNEADIAARARMMAIQTPDRCSQLGLKRALAETGTDAIFPQPEWPAIKEAIAADADLQEEWDLATVIVRSDRLVQAMIAARKYDDATVSKIITRANVLAS